MKDLNSKADENIKKMMPEQVARYFFEGCSKKDWEKVKKVCPFVNDDLKNILGELQIIEIGKSFTSGTYKGLFVPYIIKFKNGQTRSFNLALRNDNPEKMWVFDGGI